MFHPHLSRFDDEYSAGILLELESDIAEVELVGKGFDASDLRLGGSVPHERITLDLASGRAVSHSKIDQVTYERQRRSRIVRRRSYSEYEKYANSTGELVNSLAQFRHKKPTTSTDIPATYQPIAPRVLDDLRRMSTSIHAFVLRQLPTSRKFVASLSFLPGIGWMLWTSMASGIGDEIILGRGSHKALAVLSSTEAWATRSPVGRGGSRMCSRLNQSFQ